LYPAELLEQLKEQLPAALFASLSVVEPFFGRITSISDSE
jgi:hypothetical protein